METNPPANYPPLEAGHWETHPPPPGAANLAPPPNQYHPQYNQPYPPTHYNQPQPNYSNRPNAPAFNGAYWPDARKRKFNHNPNRSPFESFAKLYIAQIPRTSTEEDIRSVFGQYGKIIEVVFIKDKRTGQQQGNCFVKYSTVGDAEVAIHALHNQYTYPGETESLKVKFADGEQERLGIHGLKLYVKNFNRQATKKEIEEIFSKYGEVEDVHILYDELRHSRGTGFVKFSNKYMAEAAINALNGIYFMKDCEHPLLVRFAEIKKSQIGDLRYKLPPTHGITGGQFFPRNVHQYQGPVINYGASVQTYPTNPPPRATLPDAHKQTLPTSPSVSHCGFHPQQQSSPMMPATCYPNKSLQESPHSSPQILEMPSKDNDPTLQLNEDQVTQHQRSEDQLISQLHSENLSLVQRQNGDQSSLPQQNTDQGLPEQTSDTNSKPHKVDTASDVINVEPTAECMESTTLDVISSLDCDWSEHFSSDGNKYYYNSETCESRWEKPAEYASFEKHVLKLIQNETSYSASQSLSSQEVLSSH